MRAGAGLLVLVLAAAALLVFGRGWAPSRDRYPVQGIDVSHHQGTIDWDLVARDSVDFAYIKATEGGDLRDPRFHQNWARAGAAGVRRGAYHFFTLCRAGADQAANFIATVPRDPAMLAPAIDLEFGGNCAARPAPAALFRELDAFIAPVERHFGRRVILYLTREFDAGYGVSARIARPLWLRNLVFEPAWGARPFAIWQASSFRGVRGIAGPVDWNAMRP